MKPGKRVKIYLDHFLKSKAAIVNSYFSMISLNNSKKFKAYIPPIKLTHPSVYYLNEDITHLLDEGNIKELESMIESKIFKFCEEFGRSNDET